MFGFLNLVMAQFFPVYILKMIEFQFQTEHKTSFSQNTIRTDILKLVKILQERIIKDLRETKCKIIYDGWTISNKPYWGVLASFT